MVIYSDGLEGPGIILKQVFTVSQRFDKFHFIIRATMSGTTIV